jgi:hypothetical protein
VRKHLLVQGKRAPEGSETISLPSPNVPEVWLPIPQFEDSHSFSNRYNARTEEHKITRSDGIVVVIKQKPRKVTTWPNGRRTVRLRRAGEQFTVRIDWLVAEHFGGRK